MSLSIAEQVKRIGKVFSSDLVYPEGIFSFGKYAGESIFIVVKKDKQYVEWAIGESIFSRSFARKLVRAINTLNKEERQCR